MVLRTKNAHLLAALAGKDTLGRGGPYVFELGTITLIAEDSDFVLYPDLIQKLHKRTCRNLLCSKMKTGSGTWPISGTRRTSSHT